MILVSLTCLPVQQTREPQYHCCSVMHVVSGVDLSMIVRSNWVNGGVVKSVHKLDLVEQGTGIDDVAQHLGIGAIGRAQPRVIYVSRE